MGTGTIFLVVMAVGGTVMGVDTRQSATFHGAWLCTAIIAAVVTNTALLAVTATGDTIMCVDAGQGAVCNRAGGIDRPLLYCNSAAMPMRRSGYSDGRENKDTRKTR